MVSLISYFWYLGGRCGFFRLFVISYP